MTADVVSALVAYLAADAGVAALVGARVFGIELPAAEAAAMPRKALLLRESGGVSPVDAGYTELAGQRLDVFAYGETPYEARRVGRAAYGVLKQLRRATVDVGGTATLVHSVSEAGGALTLRDTEAGWAARFQSFQALYSEIEIAA